MARRRAYHHGDLRAALIDASIEMIERDGLKGFSMAAVSRKLSVAASAPYRHFTDRDDLLDALGERALRGLAVHLVEAVDKRAGPEAQLVQAVKTYVDFSHKHGALFETLIVVSARKQEGSPVAVAANLVLDAFAAPASRLAGRPAKAERLVVSILAIAHGFSSLLRDGAFGAGENAAAQARTRAAETCKDAIRGFLRRVSSPAGEG